MNNNNVKHKNRQNNLKRKIDRIALRLESKNLPYVDKLIGQWRRKYADAFVVSFPKCGRTWLRLLISRSIVKHFNIEVPEDNLGLIYIQYLSKYNSSIPKIVFEHDDDVFFKSPQELSTSKVEYKNNKVLHLVRDPRDVIVSSFFHKKHRHNFSPNDKSRNSYMSYEGQIDDFVMEQIGSFNTLLNYYNIWHQNRDVPLDYMMLRYEDLYREPKKWLRQTLNFLELYVSDEAIEDAINYASFTNMRKMEEQQLFKSDVLKPADPSNPNTYKTRQKKLGGFTKHLNEETIAYMNRQIADNLSEVYRYGQSTFISAQCHKGIGGNDNDL